MINLPRGASGPCMHIIFQLFTLLSSSSSIFSCVIFFSIYECLYLHKWLLEKAIFWVLVLNLGFLLLMAGSSSASYIHMVICLYDSRITYIYSSSFMRRVLFFLFYFYLSTFGSYVYICIGAAHDWKMFDLPHEQRRVCGSSLEACKHHSCHHLYWFSSLSLLSLFLSPFLNYTL